VFKIWERSFAGCIGLVVIAGIADVAAKRGHNRGGES
jgi:hypothetical protein